MRHLQFNNSSSCCCYCQRGPTNSNGKQAAASPRRPLLLGCGAQLLLDRRSVSLCDGRKHSAKPTETTENINRTERERKCAYKWQKERTLYSVTAARTGKRSHYIIIIFFLPALNKANLVAVKTGDSQHERARLCASVLRVWVNCRRLC